MARNHNSCFTEYREVLKSSEPNILPKTVLQSVHRFWEANQAENISASHIQVVKRKISYICKLHTESVLIDNR